MEMTNIGMDDDGDKSIRGWLGMDVLRGWYGDKCLSPCSPSL